MGKNMFERKIHCELQVFLCTVVSHMTCVCRTAHTHMRTA